METVDTPASKCLVVKNTVQTNLGDDYVTKVRLMEPVRRYLAYHLVVPSNNLLAAGCSARIPFWDWIKGQQISCYVDDVTQVMNVGTSISKVFGKISRRLWCLTYQNVKVDYFVECYYYGADDQLWGAGVVGYFPLNFGGVEEIKSPEAILEGGHSGVVRTGMPASREVLTSLPPDGQAVRMVDCVAGCQMVLDQSQKNQIGNGFQTRW